MTARECLRRVDGVKPNAFSDEDKVHWLNEVEGMVQTELLAVDPQEGSLVAYRDPGDWDKALLVAPPHDKLYPRYLAAMIDFANGEYSKYQNSMVMFNAAWDEFAKWRRRNHMPARTGEV